MATIHHTQCPVCSGTDFKDHGLVKDHSHTGEEFPLVSCGTCGFYFTQDIPDSTSIGPYYKSENYVSHSDTQKGLFFKVYHSVRNYMLKKKQQIVQKGAGIQTGELLDIGTGTGYFLNQMKGAGWQVTGIEQDDETRTYGAQKFGVNVLPTQDLYQLPGKKFDAISMWHVLEHVHDLNGYLTKIHAILKDSGVFVVAVPNHTSFDAEYYGKFWAAWDIPIHLWHFDPASMDKLMAKHGFKVTERIPMPFDAAYVSMLSEQYKSGGKLPGLLKGVRFALKGKSNPERCSSIIYIIKKN